jgi:hypothetical protein
MVADKRFFDLFNVWYQYDNEPLKKSLEKFAKFPIATSREDNQPRLLIAVDVGGACRWCLIAMQKKTAPEEQDMANFLCFRFCDIFCL